MSNLAHSGRDVSNQTERDVSRHTDTDVSRHTGRHHADRDMSGHPDADEMRERHDRVMSGGAESGTGRTAGMAAAPLLLLGLFCAVSPWVLHFTGSQPSLVPHNLVIGIAIAVLALCFTAMPERMTGAGLAIVALGAWLIIAPWVVGQSPDMGVILTNVIVGGLTIVLGAACAGLSLMSGKKKSGKRTKAART